MAARRDADRRGNNPARGGRRRARAGEGTMASRRDADRRGNSAARRGRRWARAGEGTMAARREHGRRDGSPRSPPLSPRNQSMGDERHVIPLQHGFIAVIHRLWHVLTLTTCLLICSNLRFPLKLVKTMVRHART
ncbi:hypothetical protein Y032_0023g731 [Ancylostoma ceylanicum]|uniref:Uncharacterized protein n=1 Tax=Ancylostoma ceylanicum TaxID=53326 RepID=A0A016UWJ2_9BILA|nr:hypothetical protein Y032_0023g731 [Ancylostoma ceylanicum]